MDGKTPLFQYVLTNDDLDEEGIEELLANLHPEGELEDGWKVVAIEGTVDENEAEAGGFIAVSDSEDRAYLCDEGTIRFLDGAASDLTIYEGHDD